MADAFAEQVALHSHDAERRHHESREQLIAHLVREYESLAGLTMTLAQLCRLLNLDRDLCERVIQEGLRRGLLSVSLEGQLRRAERDQAGD